MPDQKPPNPNGKKGGEKHQSLIKQIIRKLLANDLKTVTEFAVETPEGKKNKRYVDVAGLEDETPVVFVQVGKTNKDGKPVKREREAIADIEKASGIKVQFEDYEN